MPKLEYTSIPTIIYRRMSSYETNVLYLGMGYDTISPLLLVPNFSTLFAIDLTSDHSEWEQDSKITKVKENIRELLEGRFGDEKDPIEILRDEDNGEVWDFVFDYEDKPRKLRYYHHRDYKKEWPSDIRDISQLLFIGSWTAYRGAFSDKINGKRWKNDKVLLEMIKERCKDTIKIYAYAPTHYFYPEKISLPGLSISRSRVVSSRVIDLESEDWVKELYPPRDILDLTREYIEHPSAFMHIGDPTYNTFQFNHIPHVLAREISKIYQNKTIEGLGVYYLIFNKDDINARLQELYGKNSEDYPVEARKYLNRSASFAFFGYIDYDKEYPKYSNLKVFYFERPKVGEKKGFKLKSETLYLGNQNTFQIVKMGEPLTGYLGKFPVYYRDDPFEENTGENILNGKFVIGTGVRFISYEEQLVDLEEIVSPFISQIY